MLGYSYLPWLPELHHLLAFIFEPLQVLEQGAVEAENDRFSQLRCFIDGWDSWSDSIVIRWADALPRVHIP